MKPWAVLCPTNSCCDYGHPRRARAALSGGQIPPPALGQLKCWSYLFSPVLKQENSNMLKPWTPARARGISTVRQEQDASGKKMRAWGELGCADPADVPGLAGGGTEANGTLKRRGPRSAANSAPPISNDTSACPGVLRPDPSCPTTDHQCSQLDTGHPHSARVRERSSDSLV